MILFGLAGSGLISFWLTDDTPIKFNLHPSLATNKLKDFEIIINFMLKLKFSAQVVGLWVLLTG